MVSKREENLLHMCAHGTAALLSSLYTVLCSEQQTEGGRRARAKPLLKAADQNIQVRYLPVNCTAIHQPCDQGLIGAIKARYKRTLLRRTLEAIDDWEEIRGRAAKKVAGTRGLDDGYKPHLLDVATMVRGIWRELPASIIVKSWIKAACLPASHVHQLNELLSASASAPKQIPATTASAEEEQQAVIQEDDTASSLLDLIRSISQLNVMNLREACAKP